MSKKKWKKLHEEPAPSQTKEDKPAAEIFAKAKKKQRVIIKSYQR
jgi:hypothetical protein